MKAEHKDFIDRAYLHGVSPMILAHELMVHDLVEAALDHSYKVVATLQEVVA